ncbi:MAG TPA: ArsC/Spx/MgsR family protein [Saprospiraceae bacterium]|nr:ArsC/Spx/MgsR family protein [Saprospiraceae bacterium]
MKKIFYLSTCSTCRRILAEINTEGFELQDIKEKNISAADLDFAASIVGGYGVLFSRKAMKFRSLGLHEKTITEKEQRDWILNEYTFLKRPVIINGSEVYYGNSKDTVARLKMDLA